MSEWIDISQPLQADIATWPGDTPFSYELAWTTAASGSVNVGKINMSIHTGTHIDAPYHFDDNGQKTLELDVSVYVGAARVVHVQDTHVIHPDVFKDMDLTGVTRLLVYTGAWPNRTVFPTSIPSPAPELASYLAMRGVRLLGVDLPSVDPLDSKTLPAHHELTKHGIYILEGLVLDDIPAGDYDLIALPLPLAGADGSPVRAIIRPRT